MKKIILFILTVVYFHCDSQTLDLANLLTFDGDGIEEISGMTKDQEGNTYITGTFQTTIDFDPGPGELIITPNDIDLYIVKLNKDGELAWATIFDGVYVKCVGIVVDKFGNVSISGNISGDFDADPTEGVNILPSNSSIFCIQLNKNGELNWFYNNPVSMSWVDGISIDREGNILCYGNNLGGFYADPENNNYYLEGNPGPVSFLIKLKSTGQVLGAHNFTGGTLTIVSDIVCDRNNNYNIYGYFAHSIYEETGQGFDTINVPCCNNMGIFIQELSPDLSFKTNTIWTVGNYGNYQKITPQIEIDENENIYLSGMASGITDFDPSIDSFKVSFTNEGIFLMKLNSKKELQWVINYDGTANEQIKDLKIDNKGDVYILVDFENSFDLDPSISQTIVSSNGITDYAIIKFSESGDFIWGKSFGSTSLENGISLETDEIGNVIIAGVFDSGNLLNFNPNPEGEPVGKYPGGGMNDIFIQTISQESCSNFYIKIDSLKNISCLEDGYLKVSGKNGQYPYSYSWTSDNLINDSTISVLTPGVYDVNIKDASDCISKKSFYVDGPFMKGSNFDGLINVVVGEFRTGFEGHMWLTSDFNACFPVSGEVELIVDEKVEYLNSDPQPSYISPNKDTLKWEVEDLMYPNHVGKYRIDYRTKLTAGFGDTVCFTAKVNSPELDLFISNNEKTYCFEVVNGYDPNDKQVYPQGECEENYTLMTDDTLTYKIRCQNTGNSHAVNIVIEDSISENLDISTLKVLNYSHPMELEISEENIVKFKFDSILLPDSASNEPESHGYVIFQIQPKKNIPEGTIIKNKAEIYFDYNPAVVTNFTQNTFVNSIPECLPSSGINDFSASNFFVFPNPNYGLLKLSSSESIIKVELFDIAGKLVAEFDENISECNISHLKPGIYTLIAETKFGLNSAKILKR